MGVCEYCGKELADGELCTCAQAQNKREANNEIRKVFDMMDKGEFGEEERKAKPKRRSTRAKKSETFAEEIKANEEASEEKLEEKAVKKTRAKAKTAIKAETEETAEVKEEKAEEITENKTEAVADKAADTKPVFEVVSNTEVKEDKKDTDQDKAAGKKKSSAKSSEKIDLIAIKEDASEAFARFVDLFSKPVTNGATFAAGKNFTSAVIFMVAQILFSSIFMAVLICKVNNEMQEQVFPFMDLSGYTFSAGGSFILAMLFSALLAVVFALLMFAAGRAMNIDIEFKEAIAIAGIKSAFMIPCIIIAIFFTMIKAMLGIGIYLIFGIVVLCMVFGIVFEKYKRNKNAMLYLYSAVILMFLIILFVIYSNSVKLYIPDAFLK
ncbi:MAG: hypothetical protein J5504_08170 [Butyrivibrio sp.]|nr:hypothetical protein [Butyrivibrio sp.]